MGRPDCSGGSHARARIRVICSGVKVPGQPGRGSSLRTSSMARRSVAAVSRHSRVTSLGKACCQRRRHRPTWWRSRPTRGAMASLSRPAKASKTMAARWVSRLATLVAVLSWRSTSCWRSLITTLAADPGMALSWLAHGQSGATREDSQTALPVEARFRLLALAWWLARKDLARMRRGLVDPGGERLTRDAGRSGAVGALLSALASAFGAALALAVLLARPYLAV